MSLSVTEKQAREMAAFCEIARENGAVISLRELIRLASIDASELDVAAAFLTDSMLKAKFFLESGYVLERRPAVEGALLEMVAEEEERRQRAHTNIKRASAFGRLLLKGAVLVSVSGANSYLSARESEDIDFFCVSKTNGMWQFILKALLLARAHRLIDNDSPDLCFSCIMDERWATMAFRTTQQPIFARDALTAKLIGGGSGYRAMLEEAPWMGRYFPTLYNMRLREDDRGTRKGSDGAVQREGSAVLNAFLYHTLGTFLRVKSWALNRKLTKSSRHSAVFATRIGKDHYIYESNRYRKLRKMYRELEREA